MLDVVVVDVGATTPGHGGRAPIEPFVRSGVGVTGSPGFSGASAITNRKLFVGISLPSQKPAA